MIHLTAQLDTELAKLAGEQLPFATSVALNRTAVGARDEVRQNLPKRFRLRRSGATRGIQARMSSKRDLTATIFAPGWLSIHETGGRMQPTRSRLLASMAGDAPKAALRRATARGTAFRLDVDGGSRAAILERTGRRGRKAIRLLAWLSPEHEFEPRADIESDVRAHFAERFSPNFAEALAEALRTRKR